MPLARPAIEASSRPRPGSSSRSTAQELGLELSCCVGLPANKKNFLLHAECRGQPHCVSVQVSADGSYVTVLDGCTHLRLTMLAFRDCVFSGVDTDTVVCFWQKDKKKHLAQRLCSWNSGPASSIRSLSMLCLTLPVRNTASHLAKL